MQNTIFDLVFLLALAQARPYLPDSEDVCSAPSGGETDRSLDRRSLSLEQQQPDALPLSTPSSHCGSELAAREWHLQPRQDLNTTDTQPFLISNQTIASVPQYAIIIGAFSLAIIVMAILAWWHRRCWYPGRRVAKKNDPPPPQYEQGTLSAQIVDYENLIVEPVLAYHQDPADHAKHLAPPPPYSPPARHGVPTFAPFPSRTPLPTSPEPILLAPPPSPMKEGGVPERPRRHKLLPMPRFFPRSNP